MRIAMPIWNGRVSPVFDVARRIVVLDVENGKIAARQEETIGDDPMRKLEGLQGLGVETLLCGAVSQPVAALLASRGIQVIPFLAGDIEEVVKAFLEGALPAPAFAMPGCFRRCRRTGRLGRGPWWRGG